MNQPQITPGSNGYLAPLPQQNWENPWAGIASADSATAATGVPEGMQNLQGMQDASAQYSQMSAPYPSFPNSAGLGSQNAFSAAPPTPAFAPSPGVHGGSEFSPPVSQGFNPWSLSGESNAR